MTNFDQFIEAVKQQMQPERRVQHVIGTLQQLSAVTPEDVTLADLVVGWQVLARPQSQNEEASVAHRRQIWAELSAIAAHVTNEQGNRAGAVKIWQAWQDACQKSADPHQARMVKTIAREVVELQSALSDPTFAVPRKISTK